MNDTPPTGRQTADFRLRTFALLLILLVAAGLRLYRLPELPLGFHYDEAANGILAGEIARGVKTPIFIPSYTGKEVLFFYWAALWMKLLGMTPLALRLSAALAGLLTVAATVWAVHELLYGWRDAGWVALLSGTFLATSFWHLILSRYGFRAVTQPLMQALTVAALWRGLRLSAEGAERGVKRGARKGLLWLVLAGLCCGLTAYTYLAARAFPIPLAAALLPLLGAGRRHRRARLRQLILFVAVAALALAPLAHYWLTHPGSFLNRAQQVAAASWDETWTGIRACLGMFFLRGDPYVRFNLPHRPFFDPATAGLFLLGILALVFKSQVSGFRFQVPSSSLQVPGSVPDSQHPAPSIQHPVSNIQYPMYLASRILLLTYLPIMLLPSALAVGDVTPSNLRTAGLLPFIYLFPALGLSVIKPQVSSLKSQVSQNSERALRPSSFVLRHSSFAILLLLLLTLTPTTATAYFRDWATSVALYHGADGDLVSVAAYLNQADLTTTTPYVASIHYRHPTLAFLVESYGKIRWLTGGRTVVFPAEGDALLIFPRSASADLAWVESVLPDSSPVTAQPGPGGAPAFHAYHVGPAPGELPGPVAQAPGQEPGETPAPSRLLAADLAHVALLLGYDVVGEPRSGESAQVAVWWRVLAAPDRGDYGPVARLTDPWGFVWGENSPFHYPAEQWTPGEWIVDHLSISVALGASPGDYLVRFSLYSPSADASLPVLDDAGSYASTGVDLPLRLARPATPPHPDDLDIRNRLDARMEGLTLLGASLDTTSARPGEWLYLALFWQAGTSPLANYDVTLTLGDTPLYVGAPVHGTYPTSAWTAGEVVTDRYALRIPRDAPPGDRRLQLHLGDLALDLDTVTIREVDRVFAIPPIRHPLTATLGDEVELLGYDLSPQAVAPGDALTLTLYWRAMAEMDENYTVFTHLLAPDGSMSGQRDSPPVGGAYPTSLWLSGEVIADVYEIPVSADVAPGEHRLEVGMYVADTGQRLPVADTTNDAVLLQTVTVASP